MLMEIKANFQDSVPNHWELTVLDAPSENKWNLISSIYVIEDRFADAIYRSSADAFINFKRKEVKITISGLIDLYKSLMKDE